MSWMAAVVLKILVYGSEQHGWPYHFGCSIQRNMMRNARKMFGNALCVVLICAHSKVIHIIRTNMSVFVLVWEQHYILVFVLDADHLYNLCLAKASLFLICLRLRVLKVVWVLEYLRIEQWHFKYYIRLSVEIDWKPYWKFSGLTFALNINKDWRLSTLSRFNVCAQRELSAYF